MNDSSFLDDYFTQAIKNHWNKESTGSKIATDMTPNL